MKQAFFVFGTIVLAGMALSLCACKGDTPHASIIEVDKKMPLLEWPDSNYVASLDSILALEPLKKDAKDKPNIAMNAHKAPTFLLPSSVTGKKEPPRAAKAGHRGNNGASSATAASPNRSAEEFMDKFSTALSALQSDPSNPSLYKVVEAREGDDLFKLLKRTYGAGSQNLPRFYVLSTLQSVNAGVMLEHLKAGDKVRVPRI
ncbi:MAG: hypothetical protein K6E57_01925 [Fibrobacter sp.]|nr:hypothetical protein [Fibrobacter sp.]